jgi:2-polyprenyl-6-methoxyphenol hydroxylase-like FAD-dependent oxidoreductase
MAEQQPSGAERIEVRCCIAGGGPAGMMLGYLLARAGVQVLVLEKHADFLRDFRGDTVHPSTLEVMHELGLLQDFLKRPHDEARLITGYIGGVAVPIADFTHLPTRCRFVAFMPQWDFLNFLEEKARAFPAFHLRMQADVDGLVEEAGRVVGVTASTPQGRLQVRAALVVGADGWHSTVRAQAKLPVEDLGSPIDVLWMRLSRQEGDPRQPLGRFDRGRIFVMLDRGDYWQCAFVIAKGGIETVRQRGLDAFRADITAIAPFLRDRVAELKDWNDIKLLTVVVDRLRQWWRPGLLCIGDSAHAMSPVGGVGINLAIQDAVATANLLTGPLLRGEVSEADLARVARRRLLPTRVTQYLQILIQDRVISRVLAGQGPLPRPWPLRLLQRFPVLRRLPARLIGLGIRPEHVRTRRQSQITS